MHKKIVLSLASLLLLCFAAGPLAAIDVVVPGQATPAQVVVPWRRSGHWPNPLPMPATPCSAAVPEIAGAPA